MSSLHPWGWLTVFQCGVLERVAISCCVAMHVPLRSKLNCLSNKAPRHCLFLYISTEDQLPCRTKHNKAFYVTKQFFSLSLFSPSSLFFLSVSPFSRACLVFFVFFKCQSSCSLSLVSGFFIFVCFMFVMVLFELL